MLHNIVTELKKKVFSIFLYIAGIYSEIAGARYKYWSSVASPPFETILGAGQKAKDENTSSKFP